jgi:mono/diheme cytochrome c family protein
MPSARAAFPVAVLAAAAALPIAVSSAKAESGGNHPELPALEQILAALDAGAVSLDDLRALGLTVFSVPFNRFDGHGDGPFDPRETEPREPGQRPSLQGNGQLLRVNGLDAQSCNECHGFVRNGPPFPVLGIGGVGGAVNNALIAPSLIDVADSADDRVLPQPGHTPPLPLVPDGSADFNGRFANPPALFGGGGKEALGKEMTAELQALLDVAEAAPPGTVTPLTTKGISFGQVATLAGGDLDLSGVEGIGPVAISDRSQVFIKPFGRKFENFSMRDFDRGAMRFHFGIQPVEVVGEDADADGDGVVNEVTVSEMSVLHVFDVTNPPPRDRIRSRRARRGFEVFQETGCADCHVPELHTQSPHLPLAFPEVPADPSANVYLEIDLQDVGFDPAPGGGVRVRLFSDLKRHDMGPRLAEDLEDAGAENAFFGTAALWGVADSAPYLHDGRATTLFDAIEMHGGEAQAARDAFVALSEGEQADLLAFLGQLRHPSSPNEELLPRLKYGPGRIVRRIERLRR